MWVKVDMVDESEGGKDGEAVGKGGAYICEKVRQVRRSSPYRVMGSVARRATWKEPRLRGMFCDGQRS